MVSRLPDYFFEIPASSSGKYHAENDRKVGGLVHHTKACIFTLIDLHRTNIFNLSEHEVDLGIIALLAHDGIKNGAEDYGHTVPNHPTLASEFVKELHIGENENLTDEERVIVCNAIARHSGQWVTNRQGEKILDEPETNLEKAVHLSDYLASRIHIEIQLDKVTITPRY